MRETRAEVLRCGGAEVQLTPDGKTPTSGRLDTQLVFRYSSYLRTSEPPHLRTSRTLASHRPHTPNSGRPSPSPLASRDAPSGPPCALRAAVGGGARAAPARGVLVDGDA